MWCVRTYLMSSNSPSGGMKLMLLSDSNLLSLTHWWKVQSSMATLLRSLLPDLLAVIINTQLLTTIGVRKKPFNTKYIQGSLDYTFVFNSTTAGRIDRTCSS